MRRGIRPKDAEFDSIWLSDNLGVVQPGTGVKDTATS